MKSKKMKIIVVLLVLLLIGLGAYLFVTRDQRVNISKQSLQRYHESTGGGMTGGFSSTAVTRMDGKALITNRHANWHNEDPDVNEYLVDESIMNELESIIRKYKMNNWNRKKFTNLFVYDGESDSYDFSFDKSYVSFSSQIYPTKVIKKLKEFDVVIKKYLDNAETLPGLHNPNKDDSGTYVYTDGEVIGYVRAYYENKLEIRFFNGVEEKYVLSGVFELVNADTNEVIEHQETKYPDSIYQYSTEDVTYKLNTRLDKGNYKVVLGEMEVPFEIR